MRTFGSSNFNFKRLCCILWFQHIKWLWLESWGIRSFWTIFGHFPPWLSAVVEEVTFCLLCLERNQHFTKPYLMASRCVKKILIIRRNWRWVFFIISMAIPSIWHYHIYLRAYSVNITNCAINPSWYSVFWMGSCIRVVRTAWHNTYWNWILVDRYSLKAKFPPSVLGKAKLEKVLIADTLVS